jgi:hypothetical protein
MTIPPVPSQASLTARLNGVVIAAALDRQIDVIR